MKIKIVTEKEPWEVFLEDNAKNPKTPIENTAGSGTELSTFFKQYHEFLRDFSENEGACLLCERKFRPRKKEEPK